LASGTGPIVPIAAGAMAMAIFALDTTTHLEIAAGVFYVAVVLMVVRAFERRAVLFVSGACIALAVSSHLLTREGPLSVTGLVNLGIGTSAIAIVTYLALRNQSAERALTDQFRLVIDTIPTFAWRTRPDGYAEFFSRRWQDYTGLSLEQAQGWGWTEALHPDDVAGLTEAWRASLETGSPAETEARMRRSDGAYRWFLFRAEPLRDGRGAVVNWYGTYTDIEDRKRAEALLREQAGLLDLTHDTIFVRDLKNVITYWNRGAEERYGWPREQALGNSSHQLMQTIFPPRSRRSPQSCTAPAAGKASSSTPSGTGRGSSWRVGGPCNGTSGETRSPPSRPTMTSPSASGRKMLCGRARSSGRLPLRTTRPCTSWLMKPVPSCRSTPLGLSSSVMASTS
jgi:PAS domain S-box-containing protein